MFEILTKLYNKDKNNCIQEILQFYTTHKTCLISYIYGAILVNDNLLWNGSIKKNINTKKLYMNTDFLLPDGAALRTMYMIWRTLRRWVWPTTLYNLNGTDFMPYFLDYLHNQNYNIKLITLTVYDIKHGNPPWSLSSKVYDYIVKRRPRFAQSNQEIEYGNTNYSDYNRSITQDFVRSSEEIHNDDKKINLLLNFRWGWWAGLPHQELFTYYNKVILKQLHILCMNQWATVDFRVGKEKRAPKWMRAIWLESAYRLFSDPKKNWKKFFVSFTMIWLIISKVLFGRKK